MSTASKLPRISVVIPAYNCDRYVAQAVESVLHQTYSSVEIIVIDDGSQDNTRQVLQPYSAQIRYVYQDNQGVSVARNHGIHLAQGEFVAFLDADDVFLPDKLAVQLAVFEANPKLGIVHSGWRRINQQGETLMDVQPWETVPELNLESWLRWKPLGTMGTLMFRRNWLEEVGGFEPGLTHAEDVDLILRLALKGCEAEWLRQSTVCYRQHDQNTMRDGISQAKSINWVLERFFSREDIPLEIRLIEKWVRYSTLVWSSWYLYYTGFPREMVQYLQKSWHHSPYLAVETLMNWMESFTQYSMNLGDDFDADKLGEIPEWKMLMEWVVEKMFQPHQNH
ncbi:glycosyltransferase family A protein [Limnoraphis robusta]|uniref:Glycosyltransferase family A protein n=1 Tax=Limnoraphis robusta CCNP1315 TaxID=3110306 RepID=A0ABU5U2M7_9CYAN|nr:glycosyltransferase family A protein [Limnoraphis robusta]MEA5496175.1 glycosyltransferase family A protein [Limnoraphis robusta BA-68 BA1]MEA5521446.1 glycosyltransferase family A protein [Limnoraphis robusta CCNP1315]MEA5546471.1 glycosyltransferase family A protein [Limnoraphis robusta CCNP1324]